MLKKSKEFLKLKNKLKKYIDKEVVDIIFFGSFVKGKTAPKDIDLCLIFKEKIDLFLIKKINDGVKENIHISSLTVKNFFNKKHSLSQTLLYEGISLVSEKPLNDIYSLNSHGLYYYDLSKMNKNDKVKFIYTLKGRRKEDGLVKRFGGEFVVPGCFIIPVEKDYEMKEIMDKWNVKYKRKRILLFG
ncbi:nucleotidyltransferase domain-containing protein [Candidatus Woesearchaeota archaeon]|nr:nucleotidyltransferase domain-containing protein [Candidatus Woesearchaeota archaeon]